MQVIKGPDEQGVAFDFSTGAVHQLAAGQSVLVTEDSLALQYRYGNQFRWRASGVAVWTMLPK